MDEKAHMNLIVLLLCLAFIGNLFALDSTSVYAGQKVEHILPEGAQIVKGQIPAKVPDYKVKAELLDNTDTCLINCYIVLNITSDIILIPQDVKASFKDSKGEEKIREYTYEYLVNSQRLKECYEYNTEEVATSVFNNVTQQNETILINQTTREQIFCGFEDYTYWTPGLPLVAPGDSTVIKIKGKKKQYENIDIIPELYGIKFDEWAWWNSTNATMDYWVDDTNTSLWGELNITNDTIGMYYYGNCTKDSESNGSAVFVVFEEFEGSALGTNWINYSSGTCTRTVGAGELTLSMANTGVCTIISSANFSQHGTAGIRFDTSIKNGAQTTATYQMIGYTTDGIITTSAPYAYPNNGYAFLKQTQNAVGGYLADNSAFILSAFDIGDASFNTAYHNESLLYMANGTIKFFQNTALQGEVFDDTHTANEFQIYFSQGRNGANHASPLSLGSVKGYYVLDTAPTIAYGDIETGSFDDGQGNTCGYRQEINITATEDIDDYQVELNYTELGSNANGTLTFYFDSGNPPILISDELGPAALYKNTTAWGAVSYNHTTNTTYTAYQGLAINGAIVGGFNQTNAAYNNGTIWNYTSYDISAYTHGDNVSLWSYANVTNESGDASEIAYTANITIGNYGPDIENLTITSPLFNGTNATGTADFWDLESDSYDCQFNWYVNHSSIYNDTQSPCLNTSLFEAGNYTVDDIVHFTVNATDSYGGTGGPVNSSEVTVAGAFTINNYTWSAIQYETVNTYDYTINFSLSEGDENVTVNLEYHDTNITASCVNVSTTYFCDITNLEAYPVATNGTIEESLWWIEYDAGVGGSINETQYFNSTIYFGIWPTNITSVPEAIEKLATTINATYGYAAGLAGTVSGTTYLGTSSGTFSCASGNCTASVDAPDVETPTLYQVEANLTLTSAYWSETSTKVVRIEDSGTSFADSGSCYGGSNCANAYDGDWGTYNNMYNLNDYINLTFSFPEIYYIDEWATKRRYGVTTYWFNETTIPDDCLAQEPLFQVKNVYSDDFAFYCLNQSNDAWITLDSLEYNGVQLFETSVNWSINNTLTRVIPYGLTDCSSGTPILHFEVRDENTNDLIVADYAQEFYLETVAGPTAFAFSGTDDEWDICIFPDSLTANLSSFEQYSDLPDYNIRLFAIEDLEVGAAVGLIDYTRYLANDSLDYTFHTIDIFSSDLSDVDITIRKFNFVTLNWEISTQGTTDITGTSTFFLKPYTVYRTTLNKTGYQSEEFDFVPASIYYVEITMHEESPIGLPEPNYKDYVWNDVYVEFSPAEGYYSTNQILRYTVLSNSSNLDYYGVRITHSFNGTTSTVYTSNVTASPAGGSIQYTTTLNGTYRLYSYFKHNNYTLFNNLPRNYNINTNVTGMAKAKEILESEEPISGWGYYLALLVVAALSAGYVSQYSHEGAVIMAIIVLWIGSLLFSTVEIVDFFGTPITPIILTGLLTLVGIGAAVWRGAI